MTEVVPVLGMVQDQNGLERENKGTGCVCCQERGIMVTRWPLFTHRLLYTLILPQLSSESLASHPRGSHRIRWGGGSVRQLPQVARPGVAVAVERSGATKAYIRMRENTGQRGRCNVDFDWLTLHEADWGKPREGGKNFESMTVSHSSVVWRCLPHRTLKKVGVKGIFDRQ